MNLPSSIFSLLFFCALLLSTLKAEADDSIAKPGCNDKCGNVSIPYPWGIGQNCFLNPWFEIHLRVPPLRLCTNKGHLRSVDLRGSPYNFSMRLNTLVMEGCPGRAVLFNQREFITACGTSCSNSEIRIPKTFCYGIGCCQSFPPFHTAHYPKGTTGFYDLYDIFTVYENSSVQLYEIDLEGGRNCSAATLLQGNYLDEYRGKLLSSDSVDTVPVALLWSWPINLRPDRYNAHISCVEEYGTLYCQCANPSFGNPYFLNGCKVPQECEGCDSRCVREDESIYVCVQTHSNIDIAYGLSTTTAHIAYIVLSTAIGPLLMVFGIRWLYCFTKMRKKAERRVKFFKQMLNQHHSSNDGLVESTHLFSHKELDRATDHFNENRVLGKGGQGTVYKGMLVDGRIVAVKMSKLMDETQMEQFINEVVILSQLNHRNVVKLLGCCLETEVPLLAYEFISNGTLYQHVHDHPNADFRLSWPIRLKIAAESAGAVAYLHSSSSTPIYHRDIKSANILLDDKYRAKVSDFGSSKTIAIDQTHLTTLVQGTFGYLDPEYFEYNIYTEKSDVYSFGVVLLEMLTSKKPIYRDETMEQKSLVVEFFFNMQNCSLANMLDPEVVKEAKEDELVAYIDLAKWCLNESGSMRPTMKEVAMTLERIIKSTTELSMQDQQAYPKEEFNELMFKASDAQFMTSPSYVSPMYIDVCPLLHDTI